MQYNHPRRYFLSPAPKSLIIKWKGEIVGACHGKPLRIGLKFGVLLFLFPLLTACGTDGVNQQTQVAYSTAVATQRLAFQLTATVDVERGLITLEAVQDRINRALEQRQFIISTLEARGLDVSNFIQLATPTPAPFSPTPMQQVSATPENTPRLGDTPTPTPIIITPLAITPTVQSISQSPTQASSTFANSPLRDVVMSTDVGADDCAVGVTNIFSVSSSKIYVVARAVGVQSGTNLGARWKKADGTELVRFEFIPDFNIDDACIWFFADSTDFPFEAGNYEVVLEINFIQATEPTIFTINP